MPIQGNGSAGNDLDCSGNRKLVQLRRNGVDPYRLDSDGDGWSCESYG